MFFGGLSSSMLSGIGGRERDEEELSLLKNAGVYVFGSFFVQGLSSVTLPIFSVLMSTSDFGLFASYTFWISFSNAVIGLQVGSSINNAYLDYGKDGIYRYASSTSPAAILSFVVALFAVIAFGEPLSRLFELPVCALAAGVVQSLFTYYFTVHIAMLRMDDRPFSYLALSVANAAIGTFGAIGLILLDVFSAPYIARVFSSVVAAAATGGVSLVFIYLRGRNLFDRKATVYALKISVPLILHALAGILLVRINQVIILKVVGADAAGIYAYASNFGQIISTLFLACNAAFVPWLYKALDAGMDARSVNLTIRFYINLFSIGTAAFILLLPTAIGLLSDPSYRESSYIAPIIAMGFLVNFYYTIPVNYEFYLKKTGCIALGTISACVVNLAFCAVLTPVFRGEGAAVSTLLAYCVLFVMHDVIVARVFKERRYEGPRQFAAPFGLAVAALVLTYIFMDADVVRAVLVCVLLVLFGIGLRRSARVFGGDGEKEASS